MFSHVIRSNASLLIRASSCTLRKNTFEASKTIFPRSTQSLLLKTSDALSYRYYTSSSSTGKRKRRLEVDYEELKELLQHDSILLCDVREPKELEQGKISQAINIPLGELPHALEMSPTQFSSLYKIPKPEDDANMVFLCLAGVRSAKALHIATDAGFTRVKHYSGGYEEWARREQEEKERK